MGSSPISGEIQFCPFNLLSTVHFAIEEKLALMYGNQHDKFHLGPTEERSFFQIPTGCNRLFK